MSITERQEKILNSLIREYINIAEPISSDLLKKRGNWDISPATIRNEMQQLTEQGYITQPHTSAGRIPTNKGYKYFVEITFSGKIEKFPNFILKEISITKEKIDKELALAQELTDSLAQISSTLDFARIEEDMLFDILKIIGPSRTTYDKNISLINELLKKIENF